MKKNGQVAIEYLLLLLIAIALGTIVIKMLVSRDPEEPGSLTQTWHNILTFIGQDTTNK